MTYVAVAFVVEALFTIYSVYFIPGSPLPLWLVAILVVLEGLIFVGWGKLTFRME